MKLKTILGASALALTLPTFASAAIVSAVGADAFGAGGSGAASIVTPADVLEDGASNTAQQGFDEVQNHTTLQAYSYLDNALMTQSLAAGSVIDSHMIFLNTDGSARADHEDVTWTFTGKIIGLMANRNGSMEIASSAELGAAGVTYEFGTGGVLDARGLEDINGNQSNDDAFSFSGNVLTLTMRVTEPGDWVRVITEVAPVPVPAGLPLLLTGLGVFGFLRKRNRKTV